MRRRIRAGVEHVLESATLCAPPSASSPLPRSLRLLPITPNMERLIADLRVAFRRARKRIGFTIVAVLSLALGIGANTAIFSLVDAVLLRRTPVPHPEKIAEQIGRAHV